MQLYEIPSESMVPTFLVKDKVFVSKIDCGPKFPLTDVGLPDFRKYGIYKKSIVHAGGCGIIEMVLGRAPCVM